MWSRKFLFSMAVVASLTATLSILNLKIIYADEADEYFFDDALFLKWKTPDWAFGHLWLKPQTLEAGWWTEGEGAQRFSKVERVEGDIQCGYHSTFIYRLYYHNGFLEIGLEPVREENVRTGVETADIETIEHPEVLLGTWFKDSEAVTEEHEKYTIKVTHPIFFTGELQNGFGFKTVNGLLKWKTPNWAFGHIWFNPKTSEAGWWVSEEENGRFDRAYTTDHAIRLISMNADVTLPMESNAKSRAHWAKFDGETGGSYDFDAVLESGRVFHR